MRRTIWPLVALLGLVLANRDSVCAVTLDFNQESDLDGFSSFRHFGYQPVEWRPDGGIANSGSLTYPISYSSYTNYSAEAFGFDAVGRAIYMSQFFRARSPAIPLGSNEFSRYSMLHLAHESDEFPFFDAHLFASVETTATVDRLRGGTVPAGGGSFPGFSVSFAKGTIIPEHWYNFRVAFANVGDSQIEYSIEIDDYGLDGVSPLGTAFSYSTVEPDSQGFTADPTLYGGFYFQGRITSRLDDLTIVGEPATMIPACIGMAVLAGGMLRRPCRGARANAARA